MELDSRICGGGAVAVYGRGAAVREELRSTFGPVRQVAAPLPGGVVGGTNALAIVALVLGIFGGGSCHSSGSCGAESNSPIRRKWAWVAVAGLVLGYLSLIVIVGFVLVAVSAAYR